MQPDEILTRADLTQFRAELLKELKDILGPSKVTEKQWLKSSEVRKILGISHGTLQNLRVNGNLPYTKLGSLIFYRYDDIQTILERNSTNGKNRSSRP